MPIRLAAPADLPALVDGARRAHSLSRFGHQPFNAEKTTRVLGDLARHGSGGRYLFLVAENGHRQIVGALIGVIEQQLFTDAHTASLLHLNVLPEARMGGYGARLLKAFEGWAANRQAVEIAFGISSGDEAERIGRFARRVGYRQVGENYVKETTR